MRATRIWGLCGHYTVCVFFTVVVIVSTASEDQVISEDAGSVEVCVTLDHVPLVPVLVTVSTQDGTAEGTYTLHATWESVLQ